MNTKEKIKIMQAFEDGKTIEIYERIYARWSDLSVEEPYWNWGASDYRIKGGPWISHTEDKWPDIKPSEEIETKNEGDIWKDCADGFSWNGIKHPRKWRKV